MGQRYNTYVGYFKKRYGERLQKIVIDAGFSCPNRDGTLGTGGCTYCDNAAFHPSYSSPDKSSISQIKEKLNRMTALQEALRALPHFQEPPYNYDYRSGVISSVITPLHDENEREFL